MKTILLLRRTIIFILSFFLISGIHPCFALEKTIVLTIDDLPFVGESKNFHLNMIIEALTNQHIPATGFIIANEVNAEVAPTLHKFHEAGLGLGSHTYSHVDLNRVDTETYLHEIDSADKILSPFMTRPKFFRYPYLNEGTGTKKEKIAQFLMAKHYFVAPVSIDSKDFIFNQLLLTVPEAERRHFLTVLRPCYLDFIWQQTLKTEENNRLARHSNEPQILLIHANLLNAYVLPDIIQLYQQHGYRFISLEQALGIKKVNKNIHTHPIILDDEPSDPSSITWD